MSAETFHESYIRSEPNKNEAVGYTAVYPTRGIFARTTYPELIGGEDMYLRVSGTGGPKNDGKESDGYSGDVGAVFIANGASERTYFHTDIRSLFGADFLSTTPIMDAAMRKLEEYGSLQHALESVGIDPTSLPQNLRADRVGAAVLHDQLIAITPDLIRYYLSIFPSLSHEFESNEGSRADSLNYSERLHLRERGEVITNRALQTIQNRYSVFMNAFFTHALGYPNSLPIDLEKLRKYTMKAVYAMESTISLSDANGALWTWVVGTKSNADILTLHSVGDAVADFMTDANAPVDQIINTVALDEAEVRSLVERNLAFVPTYFRRKLIENIMQLQARKISDALVQKPEGRIYAALGDTNDKPSQGASGYWSIGRGRHSPFEYTDQLGVFTDGSYFSTRELSREMARGDIEEVLKGIVTNHPNQTAENLARLSPKADDWLSISLVEGNREPL
ncbi:MAG: hypothetical protein Q8P72_02485 [Candidatus Roizmanbacteria bacterium]|nr:hypothetical protein [Candidatus Roizmanbacteria bacterium]